MGSSSCSFTRGGRSVGAGWPLKVQVGANSPVLVVIVCDTDEQAIERAKRLLDGRDVEVWCADRLVTKLKPQKA